MTLSRLCVFAFLAPLCAEERFFFTTSQAGQVVAEIEMRSPESDWAVKGKEASVANLMVDGKPHGQVVLWAGERKTIYPVLLGSLPPGEHEIRVERNGTHSAKLSQLEAFRASVREIGPGHADYAAYANMPVLFARKNTIGSFSDVPLIAYCEKLKEPGGEVLQYTIIFSNEDGGTSSRALMARWGRTTDIEYVYRVYLDTSGKALRTTVQGPDHKELEYTGAREELRAQLMPVTNNNMVAEAVDSPLRFQLAPDVVDLKDHAREQVMDSIPFIYEVMTKELEREAKLRPFGSQSGEKISDPRNYAYIEYLATFSNAAIAVSVHLKNGRGFTSDLGRNDMVIGRNGWVRTTVELPPGTSTEQIAAVEFRCLVPAPSSGGVLAHSGTCNLQRVNKAFRLGTDYIPAAPFLKSDRAVTLLTGQSALLSR